MFTMAAKKDFEERYFDFIDRGFIEIKQQVSDLKDQVTQNTKLTEKVHSQTKKTNGRVTHAEKKIEDIEFKISDKKTIVAYIVSLPPKVLYLLAISCVIALIIVAGLLKIDISGVFGGQN